VHVQRRFPSATLTTGDAKLDALAAAEIALVESPARDLHAPRDLRSTAFQ
jgi:hypothetical protein